MTPFAQNFIVVNWRVIVDESCIAVESKTEEEVSYIVALSNPAMKNIKSKLLESSKKNSIAKASRNNNLLSSLFYTF